MTAVLYKRLQAIGHYPARNPGPQAEALRALQEAERIAPEETRVHYVGRAVIRELLQLSGLRPRPELRDIAERFGVPP